MGKRIKIHRQAHYMGYILRVYAQSQAGECLFVAYHGPLNFFKSPFPSAGFTIYGANKSILARWREGLKAPVVAQGPRLGDRALLCFTVERNSCWEEFKSWIEQGALWNKQATAKRWERENA